METIYLNLIPTGISPVAHASQFDYNRAIAFVLFNGDEEYTIPDGAVVSVSGTKSDGHPFNYDSKHEPEVVTYDGSTVTVNTTVQMCAAAGKATCELKIATDGATLYTLNFILEVEEYALPADAALSEMDVPLIYKAIEAGTTTAADAEAAAKSAEAADDSATAAQKSAEASATSAGESETSAKAAKASETNAAGSATEAESYAHGGTGTRTGEDTDNAKYYSEQSKASATAAKNSQSSAAGYATKAGNQATEASKSAEAAKTAETNAGNYNTEAQSYAVGGTGTRTGEDTDNAQYYAKQAAKSAEEAAGAVTGVATWNGRAGAVKPQSGDYTADMVGAVSEEAYNTKVTEIDKAVDGKAAKSTTLEGYGITDAIKSINISGKTVTVTMSDGTTKTLTTQDTTYNNATTSAAGLMTAADKKKLDGVAEGATKVTVDSALSASSTNPVQNKVVNTALASKADATTVNAIQTEVNARPSTRKLATKDLTAAGGTLEWTDDSIGDDSLIDVYASIPNIAPSAITQSGTKCSVTFDAQESAFKVAIIVSN